MERQSSAASSGKMSALADPQLANIVRRMKISLIGRQRTGSNFNLSIIGYVDSIFAVEIVQVMYHSQLDEICPLKFESHFDSNFKTRSYFEI